jgi:hypothetical protein
MVTGVHAEISLQEKEYETPTLLAGYLESLRSPRMPAPEGFGMKVFQGGAGRS